MKKHFLQSFKEVTTRLPYTSILNNKFNFSKMQNEFNNKININESFVDSRVETNNLYNHSLLRHNFLEDHLLYSKVNLATPKGQPNNNNSENDGDNENNNKNPNNKGTWDIFLKVIGTALGAVGSVITILRHKEEKLKIKIEGIEEKLIHFVENYSRDHSTIRNKKQLNNEEKEIKRVLESVLNDKEINSYFKGDYEIGNNKISLDTLLNLLYCCNIWATNKMYNQTNKDNIKLARAHLTQVQDLLKSYLGDKDDNVMKGFDQVIDQNDYNEIYNRLKEKNHLVELYVISEYLQGRSYIYEGNFKGGKKHFEFAKAVGEKAGVFEAYLSERNGIAIINSVAINKAQKEGDVAIAHKFLNANIEIYTHLMNSKKEYIKDYRPLKETHNEVIIPSEDSINICECIKQILRCYSQRINLIDVKQAQEYQEVITSMLPFLEGNKEHQSILDILNTQDLLTSKHIGSVYNHLGNILYDLYKNDIDISDLRKIFDDELSIKDNSDYSNTDNYYIKFMFNKAKNISNDFDYPKAEAENGLAKLESFELYKKYDSNTLIESIGSMESIIKHIEASNKINAELSRKPSYQDKEMCFNLERLLKEIEVSEDIHNKIIEICRTDITESVDIIGGMPSDVYDINEMIIFN